MQDKLKEHGITIDNVGGVTIYWLGDKLHRLNGPAVKVDNKSAWWIYGNEIPKEWIVENINDPEHITEEEQVLMKLVWS